MRGSYNFICIATRSLGVRRFWTLTVILIYVIVGSRASCPRKSYNNSGECTQCPVHCIYCNSNESCYLCDVGYSGTVCTHTCDNCKPDTPCTKDRGICEKGCRDGLAGQYCNKTCDTRCGSCIRNKTTKCLTCRYNLSCEIFCPDDCYSQDCAGNHCSNGCLPGFWGQTCDNRCPEPCIADKPVSDIYTLALSILSILFLTLIVAVPAMLAWKRRRSSQEDTHLVLCRPQHITRRLMASHADHSDVSSTIDENYIDNYDHVVREAKAACADLCEESTAETRAVPDQDLMCAYAKPIPKSKSKRSEENKEQLRDVSDQELMYAYAMPVPKSQKHQEEENKDEISEVPDQELLHGYAMPVPKSQEHQEEKKQRQD